MQDRSQDVRCEFFGEKDRAFGLAARTEIPRAATERQQMLCMTLRAANSGKSPLEPAATQELLYGTDHDRAQRTRARLETIFVTTDVSVEVVFKELIERSSFGMPGPVLRRRFGDKAAGAFASPTPFHSRHRTSTPCHDQPSTSRGAFPQQV
jgi:hypothetical protein